MKTILLTFDVEEFDLPCEFGLKIDSKKQMNTSKEGLDSLLNLLRKYDAKSTFFTTLAFAKEYPSLLKKMKEEGHEIASHGNKHSDNYTKGLYRLKEAKEEKETLLGIKIEGFRAPRFQIKEIAGLEEFNFKYDSSLHPTWIPGRYFNLNKKRAPHRRGKIVEIPISTLPLLRLPLFWIAFKNFPLLYSKIITKLNFLSSNYTMLYFHPWEFSDLREFNLPKYIKSKHSKRMLKKLEDYLLFCKNNNYSFKTIESHLKLPL